MTVVAVACLLLVAQPPLPPLRPATIPPAVSATGVERRTDSTNTSVALTPGYALADLELVDWDVKTVFLLSGPADYPADSLVADRATRARAWLARVPTSGRGVLADPVLRAELAAGTGDEEDAERAFAGALAAAAPTRRSYVLARAVATFVNGDRDDSALARRLPVAERYLSQLMALPRSGYAFAYDSMALVERVYEAAVAVLDASARLGGMARVTRHTADALAALRHYTSYERIGAFRNRFPYEMVATTILGESRAQTMLDSLAERVLRIVALTPAELLQWRPEERAGMARSIRDDALARIAKAAPLGRRAPPITAHAWINTPDSLYQPMPRAHAFDDGTIRVLYFVTDWWRIGPYGWFPALTRLHDAMSPWGQVVFVTHTNGHAGTDVVEALEEVAWLRTLYRNQARLTLVIAQWAAPKIPGSYDGRVPAPPPLDTAYLSPAYPAFVIDGHGVVRGFADVRSRRDEERLRRALVYLHDEAAGSAGAAHRPAMLVPADARTRLR